ncbi:PDZ domain-containing protein [Haloferula sp. BvORR071]|uniref:PDZ domain-containing protein n=1 Tax=Haloferula sp. BvORR071 TaxID=1396141 RepID=UPI000552E727|nr:PDZ domain-containing protein [Haloferula sp. BvORR071]
MKTTLMAVLLTAAMLGTSHAQRQRQARESEPEVPMMRPEEARAIQAQRSEFFDAIRPVTQTARLSTVWIWADTGRGRKPVGFGTVVGDGSKVLTKWSEIAMAEGTILVVGHDSASAKATVAGVYQEDDLAMLTLDGAKFQPVTLAKGDAPKLGKMLVAASPEDSPAGFGVVAVESRSLRDSDQAFLGVGLEPKYKGSGVKIGEIQKGSAALDAGLSEGDVILALGGRSVNSSFELRNALTGHRPGERVEVRYQRGGKDAVANVLLKEKKEYEGVPNGRLRMMERMGTNPSLVRSGFPAALQTDMPLERDRCGGPVVDLDGKVIGIAIARADRTRSFIIPSAHLTQILATDPSSVDAARLAMEKEEQDRQAVAQNQQDDEDGGGRPAPRMVPMKRQSAEALRRHLTDMERLMERMREEMEGMDEGE